MADAKTASIVAWVAAGLLVLLLGMSLMGDGTWMDGMAMGGMMVWPLLLLALAVYFAYKYGRMAEKVQDKDPPKP